MTTPTPHALDQAIRLQMTAENCFSGHCDETYLNMVGPFGGMTAATLLNAALQHPESLGDPVSLTVNFAGPVALGDFEVEATPLRTNRSTQHWLLLLRQNGEVMTSATAFFANRRETWSEQVLDRPQAPAVSELPRMQRHERAWFKHYDMRYISGGFKPGGEETNDSLLWVRDEPPRPLDYAALTAIGDIFAPRIFSRRQAFTPAGTVSMTHYFHASQDDLQRAGSDFLLGQATASRYHHNYADQSAHLWATDGTLLLSSTQVAYFKE
ncbi:MAG: thioesterase family protein [Pseudomonadaceae bacterium]|nr:MAG: thioesterase family protein [Pseudomonadaceae bacterium]